MHSEFIQEATKYNNNNNNKKVSGVRNILPLNNKTFVQSDRAAKHDCSSSLS